MAATTDDRPTSQTREVFRILSSQLATQLSKMHTAINGALPGLNGQLKSAGVAELVETSVETPSATPRTGEPNDDKAEDDNGR